MIGLCGCRRSDEGCKEEEFKHAASEDARRLQAKLFEERARRAEAGRVVEMASCSAALLLLRCCCHVLVRLC